MICFTRYVSITCAALVLFFSAAVLTQPQTVPKLAERGLDKASYVALAKEWKKYIDEHGESAEALCNLGMAYYYSGELEAAKRAGERAVEIEPYNEKALAFAAKVLVREGKRLDEAITLLERAREVAPDYEEGLTTLAVIHLRRGELEKSERVFQTIFDQRTIHQPLQDYAYNMLVGLPHGAIIVTNGDNDTFPALALQAGMHFREDVIVINRHLLGIEAYADAIFSRYPSIRPSGVVRKEKNKHRASALLEKIVAERKAPVYIAVTVPAEDLNIGAGLMQEGLGRRCSKEGLGAEEAARLFLDLYRLDSATDWNIAWDLIPSISNMMRNYVIGMIRLAQRDDVRVDARERLLEKALEIAAFHDMASETDYILSLQEK